MAAFALADSDQATACTIHLRPALTLPRNWWSGSQGCPSHPATRQRQAARSGAHNGDVVAVEEDGVQLRDAAALGPSAISRWGLTRVLVLGSAAKTARLRQAKEEAEKEVAAYRAQREEEFKKKQSETSGDAGSTEERLGRETATKIKTLQDEAGSVTHEVVTMLLKFVTTVKGLKGT
eukprot:SM000018S03685  [mRNA]  locus=s18:758585:760525:- [translate_table: standard]